MSGRGDADFHLGHVVGMLLNGFPPSGTGRVRVDNQRGDVENYDVAFAPGVWRAENPGQLWVCDGETCAVRVGRGPLETRPAGRGRRPRPLYPFFPLDAPIWGRRGDDWRMRERPRLQDGTWLVELENLDAPEHTAEVAVDPGRPGITAIRIPGSVVDVVSFDAGPPDVAAFRLPG